LFAYGELWSFEVGWTVIWLAAYGGYQLAKWRLPTTARPWDALFNPERQFKRSFVRLACITVYLTGLYLTPYWLYHGREDTTWLLYVLALIVMAEFGETEATIITTFAVGVLLASVRLLASLLWSTEGAGESISDSSIKAAWLVLLTALVQLLVKLFSYQSANLRLVRDVQRAMPTAEGIRDQATLLARIVGVIHTNFEYKDVNILMRQEDGTARIVATASADKSKLEVVMQLGEGITGYVLETGEEYYENDVVHGREKREGRSRYKPHPAFPGTVAELAVPIKRDGEVIGVLDIQDTRPNAFIDPDVEVMTAIADHIGTILQMTKGRIQASSQTKPIHRLNQRQVKVMKMLLDEASLKEIGRSLSISLPLVKKTIGQVSRHIRQRTGEAFQGKGSYRAIAQKAMDLNLLDDEVAPPDAKSM
jgi:DNA-binding CsgD family transcriptional regulator